MGISSSPKITLPNTMATFLGSILFLSLWVTTRFRCSMRAFSVAWWTGGSRRIFDRRSTKLFASCSTNRGGLSIDSQVAPTKKAHTSAVSVMHTILQREPEQWFGKLAQVQLLTTRQNGRQCRCVMSSPSITRRWQKHHLCP